MAVGSAAYELSVFSRIFAITTHHNSVALFEDRHTRAELLDDT